VCENGLVGTVPSDTRFSLALLLYGVCLVSSISLVYLAQTVALSCAHTAILRSIMSRAYYVELTYAVACETCKQYTVHTDKVCMCISKHKQLSFKSFEDEYLGMSSSLLSCCCFSSTLLCSSLGLCLCFCFSLCRSLFLGSRLSNAPSQS